MISPRVQLFSHEGKLMWESAGVSRVEILARFGAEESSARMLFPRGFPHAAPAIGMRLRILFGERVKFNGRVSQARCGTADFPFEVRALRKPRQLYQSQARGLFLDQTPTGILEAILAQASPTGIAYAKGWESDRSLDRLEFHGLPLFYAVDLLAKLAGNWLWRIGWDGELYFEPPGMPLEHVWRYDANRMALRPGQQSRWIKNQFLLSGGVSGGKEFARQFESAASIALYGGIGETLFARPVTTEAVFQHLREAILEGAVEPSGFRYVDRLDGSLEAEYGECVEIRGGLPPGLESPFVFRIAAEETVWDERGLRRRLHVAQGLESASRFLRYLDHEPNDWNYVASHLGPFALDVSSLDSEAHLDT